jgi:hypothetical protein
MLRSLWERAQGSQTEKGQTMRRHLLPCVAAVGFTLTGLTFSATTTVDDFEGYADSGALNAAFTTSGFPVLSLITSGGASSTAQYIEIIDDGFSMSALQSYGAIVPSNGTYRLKGFYQNGQNGGVTQYFLEVNLLFGASIATVDINTANSDTVVSTWTPFQSSLVSLTTSDVIQIEFKGQAAGRAGQSSAFDEIELEGPLTVIPLNTTIGPDAREWLTGSLNTITASAEGGTVPYTQAEFDVGADTVIDFTDTTVPFEFNWDTSSLGTTTPDVVTIEVTVTDTAVGTATDTAVYTVDNRDNGRIQLITNGDFEIWTVPANPPDGWFLFNEALGSGGAPGGFDDAGGNMTIFRVDSAASPENVSSGQYSLGVNFAASDFTNRYAVRSPNLYPGGNFLSRDSILSFWGKGGSARMYHFESTDGGVTYEWQGAMVANASSPVLIHAFSSPTDVNSDDWVVGTHQFSAGDHFYDDVSVTTNQLVVTSVEPGLWNLYH